MAWLPIALAIAAGLKEVGGYIGGKRSEFGEEQAMLDELAAINPEIYAELRATGKHPQWIGGLTREEIQPYLRRAYGANITESAKQMQEAVTGGIGQQLAQSIRQAQLSGAQRGMYRSGTTQQQIPGQLTEAANRDIASAIASIQLQKSGMIQGAYESERNYNLDVAKLNAANQEQQAQSLFNLAYMWSKMQTPQVTQTNPALTNNWMDLLNSYNAPASPSGTSVKEALTTNPDWLQ